MAVIKRLPLKYYGGKQRFTKNLLKYIPEHQTYVEVFTGGAALFFAKPPSPIEVLNDLDSGLMNFFRVLRDPIKFRRFQFLIELTPFGREEFLFCKKHLNDSPDYVERARRFFVVARQSYGGDLNGGFAFSVDDSSRGMAKTVSAYLSAIEGLPEVAGRLRMAEIENDDFRAVIKRYDRPGTFFYLDPPYVHATRKTTGNYAHEMSDQDHEDLIDLCLNLKGTAMLSGYANPIYKPLEDAVWERHDFETAMGSGKSRDRVESVWLKKSEPAIVKQEVRGAFSLGDLWDCSDFFIDPVPTLSVPH